jgi:RimJ/RimL family protein N-acetyltransferase
VSPIRDGTQPRQQTQPRDTAPPAAAAGVGQDPLSRRERHRGDLGQQLNLQPGQLGDDVSLTAGLAIDSLGMMTIIAWLESHWVVIGTDHLALARVDDVLRLLDPLPAGQRTTLVLTGRLTDGAIGGPADLPTMSLAGSPLAPSPASSLAPSLANRVFRLTTVVPGDVDFLFSLAVAPETGFRWRYRGAPPPVERFSAELWAQVLVHYVVRRAATNEPAGYVVAYGADLGRGHVSLGAVFTPQHVGTGMAAQATAMFVRYLFHTFPLRKIYLEVPGFNWPQIASAAGTLFEVEGVLREHDYYAGRHWDKYICAIYPDRARIRGDAGFDGGLSPQAERRDQ